MNLQKGLVGHWTLDAAASSNGTAYDSSAYDNHGTINSGVTVDSSGIVGDSFSFDGSASAYIGTGLFYNTTTLSQVTVSAWYNSSSTADQIIAASDRNEYWRLGVGSDAEDGVQWTVGSSDMVSSTSRSSLQDGSWHHIAGVFDANLTNDHKIYIDGQLDSEASFHSGGIGSGNTSYTHIGIGSEASSKNGSTGPDDSMNGELDDVRVYHRGLSASEVSALYQMRSPRTYDSKNSTHRGNIILYLDAKNKTSYQQGETVWRDISGNRYDAYGDPDAQGSGTSTNQFPEWQPQNGGRFYFDGSHGLTITDTMSTSGQLTIEAWMKRSTSGESNYLSDARNGTGNWHLTNYSSSNINLGNNLEADDPDTYQENSNWWGDWHHFVMTSDGSNSKLYVDANQITDSRLKSSNGFSTGLGQYFRIGNRYTSSGRLVGHLGAYRLYDAVLSDGQVAANYNAEKMYYR